MGLSDAHDAELRHLQRLAYGQSPHELDQESLARLAKLERMRTERTTNDGDSLAADLVRNSPEEPPRRSRAALIAAGSGALGALFGVGVASVLWLAANSPEPLIAHPEAWDEGSIRYVGSYETADFWTATRSDGQTTCLIAEDPTSLVTHSAESCKKTSIARESGLTIASLETQSRKPALPFRIFTATISEDRPIFTILQAKDWKS